MATLQFLVLAFQVRVLAGQRNMKMLGELQQGVCKAFSILLFLQEPVKTKKEICHNVEGCCFECA